MPPENPTEKATYVALGTLAEFKNSELRNIPAIAQNSGDGGCILLAHSKSKKIIASIGPSSSLKGLQEKLEPYMHVRLYAFFEESNTAAHAAKKMLENIPFKQDHLIIQDLKQKGQQSGEPFYVIGQHDGVECRLNSTFTSVTHLKSKASKVYKHEILYNERDAEIKVLHKEAFTNVTPSHPLLISLHLGEEEIKRHSATLSSEDQEALNQAYAKTKGTFQPLKDIKKLGPTIEVEREKTAQRPRRHETPAQKRTKQWAEQEALYSAERLQRNPSPLDPGMWQTHATPPATPRRRVSRAGASHADAASPSYVEIVIEPEPTTSSFCCWR